MIRITRRGGFVVAVWASIVILALALVLFVVFSAGWLVWSIAGVLCLGCLVWLPLRFRTHTLRITSTEVRLNRGRFICFNKRIPRRFVSSVSLFSSPLQRVLGVCCLVVHTAGLRMFILGVARADANKLLSTMGAGSEVNP